jgi:signal peptidase I
VPQALVLPRPRLHRPSLVRELSGTIFFIIAVYVLAEMSFPRSNIDGPSMQPALHAGQYLIISRLHYLFAEPQRGDIAVFQKPGDTDRGPRLIKRVIGVPGDTVELRNCEVDCETYVNGMKLDEPYYVYRPCRSRCQDRTWRLDEDQYFMMGDNRNNSNDSRSFGPVDRGAIVGRAIFRYLPFDDFGTLNTFR